MILGIDPGMTTGWVLYDPRDNTVVDSGEFPGNEMSPRVWASCSVAVVEVPVGQGPTYPQVVRAGVIAGQLYERLRTTGEAHFIERLTVRQRLTFAIHNVFRVTNDATAWRAVKIILHGNEDADRRGSKKDNREPGPLAHIKGNDARAALAAALAWTLPDPETKSMETK